MQIKNNELFWAKVPGKPYAKIPTKKSENAGYDIYAAFNEESLIVPAHNTVMVPTGIACAVTPDYYLQVEERGSSGTKGMKKSAGVIDSGYRNEIFIAISNVNNKDLVIAKEPEKFNSDEFIVYPYNKAIAQLIVHRVEIMEINEISYEDLLTIESERGLGKLGSSGK